MWFRAPVLVMKACRCRYEDLLSRHPLHAKPRRKKPRAAEEQVKGSTVPRHSDIMSVKDREGIICPQNGADIGDSGGGGGGVVCGSVCSGSWARCGLKRWLDLDSNWQSSQSRALCLTLLDNFQRGLLASYQATVLPPSVFLRAPGSGNEGSGQGAFYEQGLRIEGSGVRSLPIICSASYASLKLRRQYQY